MKRFFTLIELIISLGVFLILSALVLRFYGLFINSTSIIEETTSECRNAYILFSIIGQDIATIFYKNRATPFWHWEPSDPNAPPPSWKEHRNGIFCFISSTPLKHNNKCLSSLSEIKYELYYATNRKDPLCGWIRRSATGDKLSDGSNNIKWNFEYNFKVGYTTDRSNPLSAFTANSTSSSSYQKVIPYVTRFKFTCFDINSNIIEPDHTKNIAPDSCTPTPFPFLIKVDVSLLDRASYKKWLSLFDSDTSFPQDENEIAKKYRKKKEKHFSRIFYIGDRGQY